MPLLWRPALPTDLSAITRVAAAVHPGYPERPAVFAERLRLSPAGCRVLTQGTAIVGYLLSHPWTHLAPPPLDSLLGRIPAAPTTYYLHDLALLPEARGQRAADVGVRALLADVATTDIPNASLIAVAGAGAFWIRFGFRAVEAAAHTGLRDRLACYGDTAILMVKDLR
jgi:ribosomal protein S18 acetylase RimI-like enzyme